MLAVPPPYGYMAEWSGKRRRLIPDENTVDIVRFIFEKFVETESYTAVADELNHRQINPLLCIRKQKKFTIHPKAGAYKGWDKSAVERILKSGNLYRNFGAGKNQYNRKG